MGAELYQSSDKARELFDTANAILGFDIRRIMFEGPGEELMQTNRTQPAMFLHAIAVAAVSEDFAPDMVAGHSLGEFSALVAAGGLSFENGLRLVSQRAVAMQKACDLNPSAMAVIIGLADDVIEAVCKEISTEDALVVPANYNAPGQLVISGTTGAVAAACEALKAAGAKIAKLLPVGGAFHSPLMEPAREELAAAIAATDFTVPVCPIYQNVNARPTTDIAAIKENLIAQLTAPVLWTQSVQQMITDGAGHFLECGAGNALQGMIKRIDKGVTTGSL